MPLPTTLPVSCEFFPPRTEAGLAKFRAAADELQALHPEFFSVTFGAGGSTQEKTVYTVLEIQRQGQIPAAPHLSCITSSKMEIKRLLDIYRDHHIRHLVALRGDRPSGAGSFEQGEFQYANQLVHFIREHFGDQFAIKVAAYPEFHPEASSAGKDLENFKRKVQAGADSAVTQYFFNPDAYFRFVESCSRMGISIPIVPGIMPITNYTQLARFSDTCGAEIPRWLRKRLEACGEDKASLQALGTDVVADLCRKLIAGGAPGLHFYTLNQAEPVLQIVAAI